MTDTGELRLYELVLGNGRSASPYVWRIRYALAHKGLTFKSVPVGFTDIPSVLGGRFKTVPILEHGDTAMAESWHIAEYLDRAFPGTPALFSNPAELALVRLSESWFSAEVLRKMFSVYALDVHDAARSEDQAYFRSSREARIHGRTLEDLTADRQSRLPALRQSLAPMRAHLAHHTFLGGPSPNYADYIAISTFIWVASVATLPMLERDDPLHRWIETCFDLYGGLGRDPRMKALSD